MPGYRLDCVDGAGHIELADWIQTSTDEEAIATARELRPNDKCEIWLGSRLVAKISAPGGSEPDPDPMEGQQLD